MSSRSDHGADGGLSRRDLLKALPMAALLSSCRQPPYRRSDFALPARSAVGLFAAPDYGVDLADVIGRGLREFALDVRGKSVLLKPIWWNTPLVPPSTPML